MARNGSPPKYLLTSVWFNDSEKAHYEQWLSDSQTDLLDVLISFHDNGLKLSISPDRNGSVFLISVTFKPLGKRKNGYVFMYRHSDLDKALRMALFHAGEIMDWGSNLMAEETETDW